MSEEMDLAIEVESTQMPALADALADVRRQLAELELQEKELEATLLDAMLKANCSSFKTDQGVQAVVSKKFHLEGITDEIKEGICKALIENGHGDMVRQMYNHASYQALERQRNEQGMPTLHPSVKVVTKPGLSLRGVKA